MRRAFRHVEEPDMAKSDHKRHSAKHKIDRRLGVNLWGRPKSPLNLSLIHI